MAVLFALLLFLSDPSWGAIRVCSWVLAVGWCSWAILVRPQVSVEGGQVHLRNSLVDVFIPAQLVDDVTVRSYLILKVGQRRYTSTAVGYRPSSVVRGHADLARGLVSEGGRTRVENPVAYTQDYLRAEVARIKATAVDTDAKVTRRLAYAPCIALLILVALIAATR